MEWEFFKTFLPGRIKKSCLAFDRLLIDLQKDQDHARRKNGGDYVWLSTNNKAKQDYYILWEEEEWC